MSVGLCLVMLAVGPPALGVSLWAMSTVPGASLGWIGPCPPGLGWAGLACLYYFMPNTKVRRRDAIAGGLLASVALELGKRGFTAYLLKIPTYKAVYGAFAAFPMFLLWVYFSWLVTLAAALVAASLGRGAAARRVPSG